MRLNNREDLTPICATENVPLFVMYIKGELPEKQKSKLEAHLSQCSDCKMNLAYVEEILQFKHPISLDEKTLLLKYLSDPLFYYFANNIRKKVLEDVKELLQEAKIEVKKIASSDIDPTTSKPTKSLAKLHQQVPYPYFVLTVSIILFFSLGISVILVLSNKYPALQSYLPFSNSASPVVEEKLPSNLDFTLPTMSLPNRAETNRYQQLDAAINEFLSTKDRQHLIKAESIAKDIQLLYEDNYGVDLVSYYQSVPELVVSQLKPLRERMFFLINQPNGDNYQQRLDESIKLEKQLLSFGNLMESYKVKALTTKLYIRTRNYDKTKLAIDEGIRFSVTHKYMVLEGYFLLWQANAFSETKEFFKAEELLKKVLDIGQKLQVDELIISPSMSLAAFYHINDDNKKCLEISQSTLKKAIAYNNENTISLLQMAGMSAFNEGFKDLANSYLKEAIRLSKEKNNHFYLALSYTFLAITLSEDNHFNEAETLYLEAQSIAEKVKEPNTKLDLQSRIFGYYAKTKFLAGKLDEAITLYQDTIKMINLLGIQQHLEISQLHQALALALERTNQSNKAKEHFQLAQTHQKIAESNNESLNCLLSLSPIPCKNTY